MTKVIKKTIVTILLLCTAIAFACFAACDFTQSPENPTNSSQNEQTENTDKNSGTSGSQNGETSNNAGDNQSGGSQSGNGQSPEHTCSFVLEKTEEKYLKSAATCTEKVVYYKSCSCGEKGTETFEYGEALGHDYGEWKSNGNGTHTKTCSHDSTHTITENCRGGTATCTEQATCEDCNAKYGDAIGHSYTNYVSNNNATCENNATETATCDRGCGTTDTRAIENTALGHNYDTPTYSWDGDKCTATRICLNDNTHTESETVTAEYVKDTEATCTTAEKGHYKAIFKNSAFVTQTTEKDSVVKGEALGHTFNQQNTDEKYCKSSATCMSKALYYKSCSCGKASETETFEAGTLKEHSYTNKECYVCGKKQPSEGLVFTLNEEKTEYSVTGIGDCVDTELVIPETYNDLPVTSIGYKAFYYCSSRVSVTIGNSMTSIGDDAFYGCDSIENIYYNGDINDWVQIEGIINLVVYGKSSKNLYINGELLTEANITTATKINTSAFDGCSSLTSIAIGNSVTSIGEYAFRGCSSLTSIEIPNSVTSIGSRAFSGCSLLQYNEYDNAYYLGNEKNKYLWLIKAKSTDITSCTINKNCKGIAGSVFYTCNSLTSITIPNSVTSIGIFAFGHCSLLTSITIPDSVTSIGIFAFRGCSSLTSVTIPNSVTSIGNEAFYDCSSLTSVTIGNGVTSIGEDAFYKCSSLTSIEIPNSVTSIGGGAFRGCSSLKNVTIPNSVTSIGEYAFSGCDSLKSVTIPDSVTSIGSYAFRGCSSLKDVTIPDSVTSIGSSAFKDCSSLTSVTMGNSVASMGSCAFYNCDSLKSVTIGSGVTSIEYRAFYNCSLLTSIEIPNSVTSIGSYAFEYCSSLTSVTIPNSVTSIGDNAFKNCSSLQYNEYDNANYLGNKDNPYLLLIKAKSKDITTCNINENCRFIYGSAFSGCSSLTSITIPSSVTSIGSSAFYNCTALTEIKYNATECADLSSSNYVFSYAGKDGTGIKVTIGKNVKKIPAYLFYSSSSYSPKITEVVFKEGSECECIGDSAFRYCSSLTSITIPNSVTSIGDSAFYKCSSLTSIEIPNSVTSIGSYAFGYCSSLTSITIGNSVTCIGYNAFYGCSSLTSVTFENPNGWYVCYNSTATSGTDLTLTNTATNATYLKSTYSNYYWKRK